MRTSAIPIALLERLGSGSIHVDAWFRVARESGLDAVEVFETFTENATTSATVRLRSALDAADLAASMVTSSTNLAESGSRPKARELWRLRSLCELACALGAPFVRVFCGYWPKKDARVDVIRRCADRLLLAAEVAAEFDIRLALENHPGIGTSPTDFVEILSRVATDRVVVNYDTSNFLRDGSESDARLGDFVSRVRHIHLSDVTASLAHTEFGNGVVPFERILRAIKHNNPDVVLSLESPTGLDAGAWKRQVGATRTLWHQL